MVKLSLSKIMLLLLLFVSIIIYSQKRVNLIIFIDDKIITNSLGLKFNSKTSENEYKITYYPGIEIDLINSNIFKEDMMLQFDYSGFDHKVIKTYNYNISLDKGLFDNTYFLIINIYNLDKKKYKRRYCKIKEAYVVDFHKSGLYIDKIRCK
jgi:uncharacterized protein YqhQ